MHIKFTSLNKMTRDFFQCIPKRFKCDLDDDCMDLSDETSCGNHTCAAKTQFQCQSGHCIAAHFKCGKILGGGAISLNDE